MSVDWERWARASGIGFVVFVILAFVVGGETPSVGDPVEEVASYYDGDRGQVLASSALFAVALAFWIWFAGTLANNLRERGEGRVAATIIGAVATFTGPDVQELLHSATIAIVAETPLETLWHAVPSFPTVSEVWLRLLEAYGL